MEQPKKPSPNTCSNKQGRGYLNGVIDLKTGEIQEHKPEFFITQKTNVNLDPNGTCTNFLYFLDTIMDGNQEMIDYLQKLVGYCLTGSISEKAIFIFYGHGQNGKSTFLRVLHDLMGDYIKPQTTRVFMERQNDGVQNDLAGLHDCRLVTTSEIGKHGVLDAPMIKEFTGGDPITCRFLYRESFTYIPKFKLIMAVNDRPNLSVKDSAIWKRVKMIPFTVRIPDDKIVAQEQLLELYHLEMPKILDWAVQGAKKWIDEGLGDPPSVVKQPKITNMKLIQMLCGYILAAHRMKKILFCVQTFTKITNLGLKKTKLGCRLTLMQRVLVDQSCGSGDQNQKE